VTLDFDGKLKLF